MNKWQRQINKIPIFEEKNKDIYKYKYLRSTRIILRRNIKKYKWSYEEFKKIATDYIIRHDKVVKDVRKEFNL